jgi:O-antigen ligase
MVPPLLFIAATLTLAAVAPALFWGGLVAAGLGAVLFLAICRPTGFCAAWVLIAGMSLEMALADFVGPEAFQPTIAVIKALQIGLALICALRWGVQIDPLNPAFCFLLMGGIGLVHGLAPGLTPADSLRSIAGSVAPFVFGFVRLPPFWAARMIRVIPWCAVAAVLGGAFLAAAHLRPLFIESGGWRLAGLGHPAFLANVCLPAVYASLLCHYRDGGLGSLALIVTNMTILLLTGARAPFLYGALLIVLALLCVTAPALPIRRRLPLLLIAGVVAPICVLLSGSLTELRLFSLLNADLGNLSGRDLLWPVFEGAARDSPWFGWGIGAGNVIIPSGDPVARVLHTWAAHNEYLRIEVEGGQIGRSLLLVGFAAWVWRRSRPLVASDRGVVRLIFIALSAQCITDNVLISTPACVLFTLITAIFASPPACPIRGK